MRSIAAYIPAALFVLVAAAMIMSGKIPHRVAYDQLLYHGRAIEIFAQQWPAVDLSDYLSATTPAFHLTMAVLARTVGLTVVGMQAVCAVITAVLLVLLAKTALRSLKPLQAVACVLPFGASMYVFASGAWVLPDNAAWLGVLLMILLALAPRFTLVHLVLGAITLLVLTCTRQIHFWTGGLLIAAAWLAAPGGPVYGRGFPATGLVGELRVTFFDGFGRRCAMVLLAMLAALPAALVLVWFYRLWHGLVPPSFQHQYHGSNPAGPAFILAVFGLVACFFGGWTLPRMIGSWRSDPVAMVVAVAVTLLLVVVPVTTAGSNADYFAGRRTGLWDVAAKGPMIAGHTSLLMAVCTLAGGITLAAYVCRWNRRAAIIMVCAFIGYGCAVAQGGELWQRYAEPFALMMMVVMLGLDSVHLRKGAVAEGARWGLVRAAAPVGALVLTVLFVALNVRDLRKPDTQLVTDPAPPSVTPSPQIPNPRKDSPFDLYMMAHEAPGK